MHRAFAVALIAGCLAAPLALSGAQQDSRAALQPRNDDERAIARYFSKFREKAKAIQPGQIVGWGPHEMGPPPPPPRPNPFDELRAAVCKTDVIATGQATPSRVIFNEGETILVTLYDFKVDTWLKIPAVAQRTIQVALAGGEALLDGQKTVALMVPSYRLDEPSMMWLKRIPGSRAFALVEVGILTFDGDERHATYGSYIPLFQSKESPSNTVTAIVNAAATCR